MSSLQSDPQQFELFFQDNLLGTTPVSANTLGLNWQRRNRVLIRIRKISACKKLEFGLE